MKPISRRLRPDTITLYNYIGTDKASGAAVATYQRTSLDRVCNDTGYAQRLSQRGVSTTDNAQLTIELQDYTATGGRTYLPYIEWKALTDKSGYFTFKATDDFFVSGNVTDTLPAETKGTMQQKYQVFSVTSVSKTNSVLSVLGK